MRKGREDSHTSPKNHSVLLTALLVIFMTLAACGKESGGSSNSASTGTSDYIEYPPSPAKYIKNLQSRQQPKPLLP